MDFFYPYLIKFNTEVCISFSGTFFFRFASFINFEAFISVQTYSKLRNIFGYVPVLIKSLACPGHLSSIFNLITFLHP